MKKLIAALALIGAARAEPARDADFGVSISLGQPGYYGQLDLGRYGAPQVVYRQPVVVQRRHWNRAPVYVRAPPGHYKNWDRHCDRYDACGRPVYFVRDDWYRNVYAPRYRQLNGRRDNHDYAYERYDRRDDRSDDRRDDRRHHGR